MSCDEIRGALPLDADAGQSDAVQAHLAVCPSCEELAAGYAADAASLAEYRSLLESEQPSVMTGFADAVMTAVAAEVKAKPAAPVALAPILQPSFGPVLWMAAAAALLIAIGLGMSSTPRFEPAASPTTAKNTETKVEAPAASTIKVSLPSTEAVPAPKRLVRPRMRGARSVMPVDSDGRRGGMRNPAWMSAIERLWGRGERQVPPLRKGEREVGF